MSTVLNQYVQNIIKNIDGNQLEKADIYEELMIHLQLSKEKLIESGYDQEEAEQLIMGKFGETKSIGDNMQQAMFPFRKKLFLILAIASFLYTFIAYLSQLFIEGDAHIGWLILSVLCSSLLLLFALQVFPSLDRKIWINSALIIHTFIYLYGSFLASSLDHTFSIGLGLFIWLIIIFSVFLIYRTTIYDYQYQHTASKQMNIIHAFNITIGMIAVGTTLFFLWAVLAFSDTIEFSFLLFFIPLAIWIIAYIMQIKLISRNKRKTAYLVGSLLIVLYLSIIIFLFVPIGVIL